MHTDVAVLLLFSVAAGVSLIARRFRFPYTVALVVAGLLLGTVHAFDVPHLTKELLYTVFLPGLLFEAAFGIELKLFRLNVVAITLLSIPGLLVAVVATAVMLVPAVGGLHFVTGFGFIYGLLFAAIISATDPIAVVALFKSFGVSKRLAVLIESESLLNDGTATVVFMLILSVALGKPTSLGAATLEFVTVVGMGLVVGVLTGAVASWVIHKVDDPMIEITLTSIAAYGSFVVADQFHFSGVIATVAAGIVCGNYTVKTGMSASTRVAVASFWEYLAFALNSVIFLLIGFEVHASALLAAWKPILVAYVAVTVGRAVVVYLVVLMLRRSRERIPFRWAAIMTWGGVRGGLSMVLALGLPRDMAGRELIVSMTFGVVILSILIQGTTMGWLLRKLGLATEQAGQRQFNRLLGKLRAVRAGIAELERLAGQGEIEPRVADELRKDSEDRLRATEQALAALTAEAPQLRADVNGASKRRILTAEKDALRAAHHDGQLDAQSFEELLANVDARMSDLVGGKDE